jgi:hypothetical protein
VFATKEGLTVLLQVDSAINALAGRSETLVVTVMLVAFVAWTMFQSQKDRRESAVQHAQREDEEKKRYDTQNQFHRDMALRNADQLDVMATSMDRTSKATEIMARCTESTEAALMALNNAQRRDRRAIVSAIDAIDARAQGKEDAATASIQTARLHLLDEDDHHNHNHRGS